MSPKLFAMLHAAIDKTLDKASEQGEDFNAYVYDDLVEDMTKATAVVFDANVKGQKFAESSK